MKTKHSDTCARVWGKLDTTCPRCAELAAGAPARKGWGSNKKAQEMQRIAEIKAHDCKRSGCGPVCVAFDW